MELGYGIDWKLADSGKLRGAMVKLELRWREYDNYREEDRDYTSSLNVTVESFTDVNQLSDFLSVVSQDINNRMGAETDWVPLEVLSEEPNDTSA